jgi:hypothetical protein
MVESPFRGESLESEALNLQAQCGDELRSAASGRSMGSPVEKMNRSTRMRKQAAAQS